MPPSGLRVQGRGVRALSSSPHPSSPTPQPLQSKITALLARYDSDGNLGVFLDAMRELARDESADALIAAAEPHKERLEVVIPLYERIVELRPQDARAIVTLANAYWMTGRGADVVGELAARAKKADPANRAAWHLWALAEANIRERTNRWRVVTEKFPADQLARAALADNAVSLADAEHDPLALDLAIATYEGLLKESISPTQTRALRETLDKLKAWTL
jgi:hypothetical protein